jgi:hypothetical protein
MFLELHEHRHQVKRQLSDTLNDTEAPVWSPLQCIEVNIFCCYGKSAYEPKDWCLNFGVANMLTLIPLLVRILDSNLAYNNKLIGQKSLNWTSYLPFKTGQLIRGIYLNITTL